MTAQLAQHLTQQEHFSYLYGMVFLHHRIIMNSKNLWFRITCTIFGIIAIIHLLRIITGVPVLIDSWSLPMWVNWMGLVATGFLCFWFWRLSIRGNK
jgi:hypothetical protein